MTSLDKLCATPFHEASDAARARILQRLADTELYVALHDDPAADQARMRQFDLPTGVVVMACDSEDRLSGFLSQPTPYAAMPGRVLAGIMAGQGVGMLVNPTTPSEILLSPEMIDWLIAGLSSALPQLPGADDRPARILPPSPAMIAALAKPLAECLTGLRGHINALSLVAALWANGRSAHLIVASGVVATDRRVVAKSLAEMLAFLPPQDGAVDVAFDLEDLPEAAFTLQVGAQERGCGDDHAPGCTKVKPAAPRAPGCDPDRPPILRF